MSILKEWKEIPNMIRSDSVKRTLLFPGYDKKQNPCYLIFYGMQQLHENKKTQLENRVIYDSYAIFRGKEGHFPSFPKVFVKESIWNRRKQCYDEKDFYYKKKAEGWDKSYSTEEEQLIEESKQLKEKQIFDVPYYSILSINEQMESFINILESKEINIPDFYFLKNVHEFFPESTPTEYINILYDLFTNESLYIRKKRLSELLSLNPPKEVFTILLTIGSSEIISGLFLELGKCGNDILKEGAEAFLLKSCSFAGGYEKGMKHCISLYLDLLKEDRKKQRKDWVYQHLHEMELHLTNIKGEPVKKKFIGKDYLTYARHGGFSETYGYYDYEERRYKIVDMPPRYERSSFSDGFHLDILAFKHTMREIELLALADAAGKIAYYLEAPRLHYYFLGTRNAGYYDYFKRYTRRLINSYITIDPDKFMQAMVSLLSSYTNDDIFRTFDTHTSENKFITYYLYFMYEQKAPVGICYPNMSEDNKRRAECRKDQIKKIFEDHIEDVFTILLHSKCDDVIGPCFAFLTQLEQIEIFLSNIKIDDLITLSSSSLEVVSEYFLRYVGRRIISTGYFDFELMYSLMQSTNMNIVALAKEYKQKTNGRLIPTVFVSLLSKENLSDWIEVLKEDILFYQGDEYIAFIKALLGAYDQFKTIDESVLQEIKELLNSTVNQYENCLISVKKALIFDLCKELNTVNYLPDFIVDLLESLLFALPIDNLKPLLEGMELQPVKRIPARNKQILNLLEAIQSDLLPNDSQIAGILNTSGSKMIKILLDYMLQKDDLLIEKNTTLFLMLESDAMALNWKAEELFDKLPKEAQKKLHAQILDSPIPKVYQFGIRKLSALYGECIPKEYLISLLEHPASEVKAFISDKINKVFENLTITSQEIFLYYLQTLLYFPNKLSERKSKVYDAIPGFVKLHHNQYERIEALLLELGNSNCIKDAERALTTLVKMRKAVEVN